MKGKKVAEPSRKNTPAQTTHGVNQAGMDNSSKSKMKSIGNKHVVPAFISAQSNISEKYEKDPGEYLYLNTRNNSAQSIQYAINRLNFDDILKKKHSLPLTKENGFSSQSHAVLGQAEYKVANLKHSKHQDVPSSNSHVSKPKFLLNFNSKESARGDSAGNNNNNKQNSFKSGESDSGNNKKQSSLLGQDSSKKLGPIGVSIDNYFKEKDKLIMYNAHNGTTNSTKQLTKPSTPSGNQFKEASAEGEASLKCMVQKYRAKDTAGAMKNSNNVREESPTPSTSPYEILKNYRVETAISNQALNSNKENSNTLSARVPFEENKKFLNNYSKYSTHRGIKDLQNEAEHSKKQQAFHSDREEILNRISTDGVKVNRIQLAAGDQELTKNDWWDSRRSSMKDSQTVSKSGIGISMKQDGKKPGSSKEQNSMEMPAFGKNVAKTKEGHTLISEGKEVPCVRSNKANIKNENDGQISLNNSPLERKGKPFPPQFAQKFNSVKTVPGEKMKVFDIEDLKVQDNTKKGSGKPKMENKELDEIFNDIIRKKIDPKIYSELGASPREILKNIIASKKHKDSCFSHSNDSKKKLDELNDLLCKAFLENNELIKRSYTNGSSESKKMKKMNNSSDITKKEIKSSERRGISGKVGAMTSNFTISQDETQKLYSGPMSNQLTDVHNRGREVSNAEYLWENSGGDEMCKISEKSRNMKDREGACFDSDKCSETEDGVKRKGKTACAPTPYNSQILDESDLKELLNNPNIQNNSSKRIEMSLLTQRNYSVNDVGASDNRVAEFLKRKFSLDPKIHTLSITPRLQDSELQKSKTTRSNSNKLSDQIKLGDQISSDKITVGSLSQTESRKFCASEENQQRGAELDPEAYKKMDFDFFTEKADYLKQGTHCMKKFPSESNTWNHSMNEKNFSDLSYRRNSKPFGANMNIEEEEEDDVVQQETEYDKKAQQRKEDLESLLGGGSLSDRLESLKDKMRRTLSRYKQKSDSLIMMNKILRNKLIIMNDE